jgi:hypothetical protein
VIIFIVLKLFQKLVQKLFKKLRKTFSKNQSGVKFNSNSWSVQTQNIWNAYGKDDVDQENVLTDEQWREFVRQYGKGVSVDGVVDWENISTEFDNFCEEESK